MVREFAHKLHFVTVNDFVYHQVYNNIIIAGRESILLHYGTPYQDYNELLLYM